VARPPGNFYRFRKLVRRNKLAVAAAGAVLAALILGLGLSTWLFFRERVAVRVAQQNTTKANTEAGKATAISDFLQQLVRSANPDDLKGSDYTVRQMLDDFSAGLTNQLGDQPEVEASLRATIGRAYRRLGVADQAQAHLERALSLRRRLFGNRHELVAESLVDFAWSFFEQKQWAAAEPPAREALDIYRERGTAGEPVVHALWIYQKILSAQNRHAEVDAVTAQALAVARSSPAREFPATASMIHGLAEDKIKQSKHIEAEQLSLKAVEMHRRLSGAEAPETAWGLLVLGMALKGQQKLTEAESACREALRIFRKYYSTGHKSVSYAVTELKSVLEIKGDTGGLEALARQQFADANQRIQRHEQDPEAWIERAQGYVELKLWKAAAADYEEAIALYERDGAKPSNMAELKLRVAELFRAQGNWGEAERRYGEAVEELLARRSAAEAAAVLHEHALKARGQAFHASAEKAYGDALAAYRQAYGESHTDLARCLADLALAQNDQRQYAEAETNFRAAIRMRSELLGHEHLDVADTMHALANSLLDQNRLEEAEATYRGVLAIREKRLGHKHPQVASSLTGLAFVLTHSPGRLAEAEATCHQALALLRNPEWKVSSDLAFSLDILAGLLHSKGEFAEAEAAVRETLAARRMILGEDHPDLAHTLHALVGELRAQEKLAEAETVARECLALRRKFPGDDEPALAGTLAELTNILLAEEKFAEAEPLARECLAIREKKLPDDWRTFNARAMLGRALLGQKKYEEAGPLMLTGYEGMKQREDRIPPAGKPRLREALQSLVQLYEGKNQPGKAVEWTKRLTGFDRIEAELKAAPVKP
jgi:tetratricopeptide (TPR) repeat protein